MPRQVRHRTARSPRRRTSVPTTLPAAAAALALLLAAGLARAELICPRAGSPAQARQLAADAFAHGEELYRASDCGASEYFLCSFELFPHPSTLFNAGRAAEECEDYEGAAASYRTYLEAYPDESDRAEVVVRLARVVERLRTAPLPPSPEAPRESAPPSAAGESGPQPAGGPPPRPIDPMYVGGWTAVGVGGALLLTGGILMGMASLRQGDLDRAREDGRPASEQQRIADEGLGYQIGGGVTLGLGCAALVVSGILLWLSWPHPADVAASRPLALLVPVAGDGTSGLGLVGRF